MIVLRNLVVEDAAYMLEWLNDPSIIANFSFSNKHFTSDDAQLFIANAQTDETHRHFAISDENNQYFGTISLKNINHQHHHAEYAIVLLKQYQGKGYAKEASKLLIKYAHHELKLNKLYLTVLTFNQKAIELYEKLGFVQQGVFQKHLRIEDEYKDLYYYERLLGNNDDI